MLHNTIQKVAYEFLNTSADILFLADEDTFTPVASAEFGRGLTNPPQDITLSYI